MGADLRQAMRKKYGKDFGRQEISVGQKLKTFAEYMQKNAKASSEKSPPPLASSPSTLTVPDMAQSNTFGDQYSSKRKKFLQGMA